MRNTILKKTSLAAALFGVIWVTGCKVEQMPARDPQADAKKDALISNGGAVTYAPVPATDDAALVIAACGPAGSDQVLTVNDKINNGTVRRMVYRGSRAEVALDFIPLQAADGNPQPTPASNTVWRFNQAVVENQKLLTAANIKVYLPCAAKALAKEF